MTMQARPLLNFLEAAGGGGGGGGGSSSIAQELYNAGQAAFRER